MQFYEILGHMMTPCRDDGKRFTQTERIDAITRLLWDTRYRRINPQGLFLMYAAQPVERIERPVVISSHIDIVDNISRCFTRREEDDMILGTYDNGITNAALLYLMIHERLPENAVAVFTGNEENSLRGAKQTAKFLRNRGITPAAVIVLDVTEEGWEEAADFTVENDFWDDGFGAALAAGLRGVTEKWVFVPSDTANVPDYIDPGRVIPREAWEDEAWEYDEHGLTCFSMCLPVRGGMHSDEGVLARRSGAENYVSALGKVVKIAAGA